MNIEIALYWWGTLSERTKNFTTGLFWLSIVIAYFSLVILTGSFIVLMVGLLLFLSYPIGYCIRH